MVLDALGQSKVKRGNLLMSEGEAEGLETEGRGKKEAKGREKTSKMRCEFEISSKEGKTANGKKLEAKSRV